jgi:hypothetical protein
MSSDLASESSIIRTGSDGRLRYSPTQRQDLLDAFDRSCLSAMSFSRQHGVHYQTFISWLRKRRQTPMSTEGVAGPAFAEVVLDGPAPATNAALRISLPCGAMMEVSSRAALPWAAELLTTLRRPC